MYPRNPIARSVCLLASLLVLPACGDDAPAGPAKNLPGNDSSPEIDAGMTDEDSGLDEAVGDGDGDEPGTPGDGDDEPVVDPEPGDGDGDSVEDPAFARGELLATNNACASCHLANYAGTAFYPNITPDATTGIGSWTDAQIADAIANGKNAKGESLCGLMPRLALSEGDMADMIAFLRGIPAVEKKTAAICPGHGN